MDAARVEQNLARGASEGAAVGTADSTVDSVGAAATGTVAVADVAQRCRGTQRAHISKTRDWDGGSRKSRNLQIVTRER